MQKKGVTLDDLVFKLREEAAKKGVILTAYRAAKLSDAMTISIVGKFTGKKK